MKFTIEEKQKSKTQGVYILKSSGKDWQFFLDKGYKKLSQKVKVPGFRPGKVPNDILKQHINAKDLYSESLHFLFDEAWKYVWTSKEIKKRPLDENDIQLNIINASQQSIEVEMNYTIIPDIELKDWKKIKIKRKNIKISNEEIAELINTELEKYTQIEVLDKSEVDNNDIANIDFTGYLGDQKFEGGEAKSHDLKIGSHSFIPGFEEQLIGQKVGETKLIKVTFPEDYQAKELAGKEVSFEVKVNEIKVEKKPILDETWVKDNTEHKTVEQFKEDVVTKEKIVREAKHNQEVDEQILEKLIAKVDIELPEKLIINEQELLMKQFYQQLESKKIQKEQYLSVANTTEEKLRETFKTDAINRLKIALILQKIADDEKIEVTDKDYDSFLEELNKKYEHDIEELKKMVPFDDQIKFRLKNEKVWNLIKNIVIE